MRGWWSTFVEKVSKGHGKGHIVGGRVSYEV